MDGATRPGAGSADVGAGAREAGTANSDLGFLSEELIASTLRMEEQLHVDAWLVRNPITLLVLFSPFATAAATLVPIGGRQRRVYAYAAG
ncbi:hypothetical protein OHU34_42935 [Streptomyces sp. NBC_00080]|uniref:hypothetical protein n=1 Tax=Streptomyces sp. NBC_00080 TaxID=2975645 RepID=UPI0032459A88